jgi:hypothetical protein
LQVEVGEREAADRRLRARDRPDPNRAVAAEDEDRSVWIAQEV